MMWFKCVCQETHYGPQMYVDGVMVCPHCKSPDLTQITQEEAMRNKLPWRNLRPDAVVGIIKNLGSGDMVEYGKFE